MDEWMLIFINQYGTTFSVTTNELPMSPFEYIEYATKAGSILVAVERIES